ncbi:RAD51-associated protein 2 [Tympanuchus pallidicinctus]|uniref:RAD51-associated protein 2 n=1 Tax=Tympanuchus pallidicinctus TaxID=109042 RepID=UPI0022870156|nr:RAD51-associated protein 2 [Tympanuchus pallidicinctus]
MENTYSPSFVSVPSDDNEFYLYPKCVKIESHLKSMKKEEQQKLEQSIHCGNIHQTPPNEPIYLSEIKSSWVLESERCDRDKKPCIRESFHSQAFNSERSLCRVLEKKLPIKNWKPENESQNSIEDDISLNTYRQHGETELHNLWNSASTGKNLHVLNPILLHQNNMEQNEIEADNELKQKSSDTPANRNLFQRWRQYQLPQVPFSCGTCSMHSCVENEKNVFLEKVCSTESKDYDRNDRATTTEGDNNNSSSIVPTPKPFKSIQPLEIPKFLMKENTSQFSIISNRINREGPSANLKEIVGKMLEGQPTLMQSKQIQGMQKMSEVGNQKLRSDKNIVKASSVCSEFEEKNYQSTNKQKHSAVGEREKLPVTYIRDSSTDPECNQIFAESDFKVLENSDDDDGQKSRVHICISAKKVQSKKIITVMDILRRMRRKSSHENMTTFHTQTSSSVITEALEKNKLDLHYGLHDSNSDISLQEAESKLFTNEIPDIKRYLTENTIFESSCTPVVAHNFPDIKVSFGVMREKKTFKIKFSFQNFLFGALRTQTKLLAEVMLMCQAEDIRHWFDICVALNEQCCTRGLVKSNIGASHRNKARIYLLAIILKHLKVKLHKKILTFIFSRKNALLISEEKLVRVEKRASYGRKQMQLNSCTESNRRQNTDYYKKYEIYLGTTSSKFVDSINFDLHNELQKIYFSRSSGNENSTSLTRSIFHNQSSGSSKGRFVGKHHLLSRRSERFHSTCLESVSHRKDMKKQMLVAKCLILLKDNCDRSSLEKMHYYNIKKIQYLTRVNLRFLSYLPAYSQLRFEKVNNKCSNQQIPITTIKWTKNKPRKMFNSYFHRERLRALPLHLRDSKEHKTSKYRNCVKTTKEIIYKMKKCSGIFNCIKTDRKENFKSKELQINSHYFLSKKSLPLFDTYKKIPLNSDPEDFDQISLVNQDNSVKKLSTVQNTVTSSENIRNLSDKSKAVLILPELSKTTMEKCSSLLLQDSQTSKPECCKAVDAYTLHLVNEKEFVEFPNTYLNSRNIFPSSLSGYLYITSLLPKNSSVNKDGEDVGEDTRRRISLNANKQKQIEKNCATMSYLCTRSPTVTYTYLQLKASETVCFSLQGHTETNKAVSLDPATLKHHLEYVKEQEEISDEQMHVTNESQCETVMNDLIMSHSEDEAKTFIAGKEKLKMHLSLMNNGYLGDVKDEYLPSENKITYEFELKRKFDLVLEELHMFHEISKEDENNLSSVETNSHNNYSELISSDGIEENIESVSEKKTYISSPVCDIIKDENMTVSNGRLLNEKISLENENMEASKEYCMSRLPSEELLHSPIAEGYLCSIYKKPYTWDPAFLSGTLLKEENYNLQKEGGYLGNFLSHEVTRVQPLKTCKRPIRIGLSKKARPQKLHPYLK